MLVVVGVVLIVLGVSDYVIGALLARQHAAGAQGGLGASAQPPPVARILKATGALTVLAGAVLLAVGLAT